MPVVERTSERFPARTGIAAMFAVLSVLAGAPPERGAVGGPWRG